MLVLLPQGAGAPSVEQVLSASPYTPDNATANVTVVTPVANGTIILPNAFENGEGSVTGVNIASAYEVYLVGQDSYPKPNTMTEVCTACDTFPQHVCLMWYSQMTAC